MTLKQSIVQYSQRSTPGSNLVLQAIYFWNQRAVSKKQQQHICFQRYQKQLQHKKICLITARPAGLFSLVFQVLEQIDVCQRYHITPVVYWNSICPYWSEAGYNDVRNAWEYYFRPVSSVKLTELIAAETAPEHLTAIKLTELVNQPQVTVSDQYLFHLIPELSVNEKQRQYIHSLLQHHIVIHEAILKKVDQFYNTHLSGHEIIGVHLRGKEKYTDLHFTGRGYLSLDYYYKEIDHYIERHPTAIIFLASDTIVLANKMIERYGKRIRQTVALRSNDETGGVHLQTSQAELGEQVLIDCLLLARSNFLVHGISNVPFAATYFNPTLPHVDIYKKYRLQSFWKWFQAKDRPLDIAKRIL